MSDKKNDMFLELEGPTGTVAGGSTDDQFAGHIEVMSFNLTCVPVPRQAAKPVGNASVLPPAPVPTGGKGHKAGKGGGHDDAATRRDDSLSVVKRVDKASPVLLQSYCKHLLPAGPGRKSELFQKAALTFRLSRGGAPLKLLVLLLTGVAVIDYQVQEVDDETTHPTEKVTFSYQSIEIQYRPEQNLSRSVSMRSVTFDKTKRQVQ